MHIGVDYYPEHWPHERWALDMKLMQDAKFSVVRLAEFDWVNIEPSDGSFQFAMWDEVLGLLAAHGLSAILCTPTAVMPAWMARKHPDIMAMQKDGKRQVWGVRKDCCLSNSTYRSLSRRITRALAGHFRDAPNVIGWQTDNEFGDPACYCPSCLASFQDWLREKYVTLDELNRAWGTHFWGHRLQQWDEITIPIDETRYNPSACLDWQRHRSWLNIRFQHDQVEILREVCPRHFVTHNLMGTYPEIDYYKFAADLDFVSFDNYPLHSTPAFRYGASMAADLMRGIKRKNFWIMEQTAGPGGWGTYGRNPRPGEIRSISYQQLAHGADAQVWFRWRTCTVGREQYWHGLLGHDGVAGRRYAEAKQTATEYRRLEASLEGTTVRTKVAMVYDYESLWATRIQPSFNGNDYTSGLERYYRALLRAGVNVDLVSPATDLAGYALVLAPRLHVLPDPLAARLDDYVRQGGVLLADCRTGVKDETNLCHVRTLPGLLAPVFGITIPEYEALPEPVGLAVQAKGPLAGDYTAELGADWIVPTTAETLGRFKAWHLESYAALTRHRHGRGTAWYVGTLVKEEAFYDGLIATLLTDAAVVPLFRPPPGVELSVREGNGRRLVFLINHTEDRREVALPRPMRSALSDGPASDRVTLERHGVAVFHEDIGGGAQ
jgi:beta-galactosidase